MCTETNLCAYLADRWPTTAALFNLRKFTCISHIASGRESRHVSGIRSAAARCAAYLLPHGRRERCGIWRWRARAGGHLTWIGSLAAERQMPACRPTRAGGRDGYVHWALWGLGLGMSRTYGRLGSGAAVQCALSLGVFVPCFGNAPCGKWEKGPSTAPARYSGIRECTTAPGLWNC